MTRNVFNWTFYDVEKFLRKHGFIHNHTEGSHYYYVGSHHGNARQVSVPFYGTKVFKPRTLKGIITQSGIPKEEWLM